MSRSLNDLDPRFKPLAVEFLRRAEMAGFNLRVIETRRTLAQHKANVKAGVSWARHSKHIEGLAIDVCPVILLKEKNWAPDSPLWPALGAIGEAVGLFWGGSNSTDLISSTGGNNSWMFG